MSQIPWRDNGLLVAAFGVVVFIVVATTEYVFQNVAYQEPVLHFDLQVTSEIDTEEGDDLASGLSASDAEIVRSIVTAIMKQKDEDIEWTWLQQQYPQINKDVWLDVAKSTSKRRYQNSAKIILAQLLHVDPQWLPAQYQLAKLTSSAGDNELAIQRYQNLLIAHPNHQASMINLGLLLARENRHQQAIAVQSRAIDISSGLRKAKAFSVRASSQFELENYVAAVDDFKSSIEFRPTHAPTWRKLANALLYAGSGESEVLSAFDQAINLQADYLQALHERGRFHWLKGEAVLARQDLEKVKAVAPDYMPARWTLLYLYIDLEKSRSANEELRWLKKQGLDTDESRMLAGLEYYLNQEYQKAEQNFATLATEMPTDLWIQYYLATSILEPNAEGDQSVSVDGNVSTLQTLIEDPWMSSLGRIALADTYFKNQQTDQSITVLQQLTNQFPQSHAYAYLLGKTYLDADLYLESASALQRALKLDESDSQTRLSLAVAYRRADQDQLALSVYEKLLDVSPNHRAGRYNYAWLLDNLDRPTEAEEQYLQVLQQDPTNTTAMFRLANLYVEQQQFQQAKTLVDEALAERPTYHRARQLLVEIYYRQNQLDLAIDEVNRLIVLESNRRSSKLLKSDILRDQNKLQEAAAVLIDIPENNRSRNTLVKLYNIGKRALDKNDLALAERSNQAVVETDPGYDKAWVNLSSAFNRGEKYQQTISVLKDKTELLSVNHKLVINLAEAYHLVGKSEIAISLLEPLQDQNLLGDEGKILLAASYQKPTL